MQKSLEEVFVVDGWCAMAIDRSARDGRKTRYRYAGRRVLIDDG